MTNPTLVGAWADNSGGSSAGSVSVVISGVQDGDLALCVVSTERATATPGTPTTTSGTFTSDANSATNTMAWSFSHRTLSSGDTTITSTLASVTRRQAISVVLLRNWGSVAFQIGTYTENSNGVVTATGPSIVPSVNDALLIGAMASCSNVTPFQRSLAVSGSTYTLGAVSGSTSTTATNAYAITATYALSGGGGGSQTGAVFQDVTSPTPTKFAWMGGTWVVTVNNALSGSAASATIANSPHGAVFASPGVSAPTALAPQPASAVGAPVGAAAVASVASDVLGALSSPAEAAVTTGASLSPGSLCALTAVPGTVTATSGAAACQLLVEAGSAGSSATANDATIFTIYPGIARPECATVAAIADGLGASVAFTGSAALTVGAANGMSPAVNSSARVSAVQALAFQATASPAPAKSTDTITVRYGGVDVISAPYAGVETVTANCVSTTQVL